MSRSTFLRRDQSGAAALEFALTVPVLIMMIWGIFQIGLLFWANAGLQHALGEGARYTTLYPAPTDAQIRTRISSKVFGTRSGTLSTPSVTTPASSVCTNCRLLSVTYTVTPNFLFLNLPAVTMTRTKQVYIAV